MSTAENQTLKNTPFEAQPTEIDGLCHYHEAD